MEFLGIFADAIFGFYDVTLQESRDERPRADKGVEDVDVFIGQTAIKFFFQDIINTIQNKINDFDRRIDNPNFSTVFGRAVLKNLSYSSIMIFCFPSALSTPSQRSRTDW